MEPINSCLLVYLPRQGHIWKIQRNWIPCSIVFEKNGCEKHYMKGSYDGTVFTFKVWKTKKSYDAM